MRSDTHKHLEDCTLLSVNAQTARDGPYRHRISIEEADDVWAPRLEVYVPRVAPAIEQDRHTHRGQCGTNSRASSASQNAGLRRQGHRAASTARGRTASI